MAVNRFFSSVVRIQAERGQYVVTAGPYAYVRHPGYLAGILIMVASGPALGSWLAAVLLVVSGLPFLLHRAITEDRVLRAELPGYRDYTNRVRWRLLPGISQNRASGIPARGSHLGCGETDQGSRIWNFAVAHRQGPAGDGRGDASGGLPSLTPILLGLATHRWRVRVLDLDPAISAAGAVGRAQPFRHDALAAERAGVLVDDRAVGLVMLIVDDAAARPVQQLRQRGLALLERRPAHVLPIELEEIERAQDYVIAVPAPPEQVEHRQAVGVADDRLAIDQAGSHRQPGDRRHDERKAIGEVIAPAGVQGDAFGVAFG